MAEGMTGPALLVLDRHWRLGAVTPEHPFRYRVRSGEIVGEPSIGLEKMPGRQDVAVADGEGMEHQGTLDLEGRRDAPQHDDRHGRGAPSDALMPLQLRDDRT